MTKASVWRGISAIGTVLAIAMLAGAGWAQTQAPRTSLADASVAAPPGYCRERAHNPSGAAFAQCGIPLRQASIIDVSRWPNLDRLDAAGLRRAVNERVQSVRSGQLDRLALNDLNQEWGSCSLTGKNATVADWHPTTLEFSFRALCSGFRGSTVVTVTGAQALIVRSGKGFSITMNARSEIDRTRRQAVLATITSLRVEGQTTAKR